MEEDQDWRGDLAEGRQVLTVAVDDGGEVAQRVDDV